MSLEGEIWDINRLTFRHILNYYNMHACSIALPMLKIS